MKKYLTFFSVIVILLGCNYSNHLILGSPDFHLRNPPNGVKIAYNLYADKTEIPNIAYREYQLWNKFIYGYGSKEYRETLLDTASWVNEFGPELHSFSEVYHSHPAYDDYAAVGVSYKQAKAYSEWRTQINALMLLVEMNLVDFTDKGLRTPEKHFTIERYLSGNFDWIIKRQDIVVPKFRIPTEEDWNQVFGENYLAVAFDSTRRDIKRNIRKGYSFRNTLRGDLNQLDSLNSHITAPVKSFCPDDRGIYNVVGNVSEIIDKEGVSKGGHWHMKLEDIDLKNGEVFTEPNCFTGFRNFSSWEIHRVK